MIEENQKGFIDIENIKVINDLLLLFEEKHEEDTFKDGSLIIRDNYRERIFNL